MNRRPAWGARWDPGEPSRTRPRPPRLLFPLFIAAIELTGTHFAAQAQGATVGFGAILLLLAGSFSLYLLRRHPVPTLFLILATIFCYEYAGNPRGPVFLSLAVAFVFNIVRGNRVPALIALATGWVGLLWLEPVVTDEPMLPLAGILGVTAWMLVLSAGGEFARSARLRGIQEAQTRREESRRRAGEQRMRIARELHDVLAHNISLINVQAGVALHLMDDDPGQARSALVAIRRASDETLREVRSVIDILRDGTEEAPRSPAPGLADIDSLVERSSAAGFTVTKRVVGRPRLVPKDVGLAGLRIVQEALTNATRHSGATGAVVEVRFGAEELQLTVRDDGTTAELAEPGNGIKGMKERASSLGGHLTAGVRPGGGFEVDAHLPLPEDDG